MLNLCDVRKKLKIDFEILNKYTQSVIHMEEIITNRFILFFLY